MFVGGDITKQLVLVFEVHLCEWYPRDEIKFSRELRANNQYKQRCQGHRIISHRAIDPENIAPRQYQKQCPDFFARTFAPILPSELL
jgi:hypothetical protein